MTTIPSQTPTHLEPSPLGTKEYWDDLYTTEISNHSLDPSDSGTIWFSDSSAEEKVLSFLSSQILENNLLGPSISQDNCSFLDLGTGNGHFLGSLRDEGWKGRMLGVDYSEGSIEFARRVVNADQEEGGEVEFRKWDIMTSSSSEIVVGEGWDVVCDKGTFDAISLSEEKDEQGRRICEGYKERVLPLVKEGGIFLVTSCNWTEEELGGWFEGDGFVRVGSIVYRSFSFGGKKGQSVSSVCFRKTGGKG